MFRSSVAAFYSLLMCLFYRRRVPHRDRFSTHFVPLHVRSKVKEIVYRMPQILFAAEIAFCGLHRRMPQQELNLLQLATAAVAQLGTSPSQVVRCNMLQARSLTASSDHVPTTFCEMPFPQAVPALSTARKILPSVTLAASVQ